jgi:hypothetical protein
MRGRNGCEGMPALVRDDMGKMQIGSVISACIAWFFLLCPGVVPGMEKPRVDAPLLAVYTNSHLPADNACVAITNPRVDVAMLVTSVEFEGQLPELRYFYHGVYGRIKKNGEDYEHFPMAQTLSLPVGTCLLLPGQSASWKRPIRVLDDGYRAQVTWREIPVESVAASVWFGSSFDKRRLVHVYEPLSEALRPRFCNVAAGTRALPPVIVEGQFPAVSAKVAVPCVHGAGVPPSSSDDVPEGSIEFRLEPVWDSVVVTGDKVTFRKMPGPRKGYEVIPGPDISPAAIDFIFLCSRGQERTIPCILSPEVFGDLIEVKRAYTEMYYNPGITQVPLKVFSAILERARERNLPVQLRRIDPNSLGRQHVLVIGVDIGNGVGERDPRG